MEKKICSQCNIEKHIKSFYKKIQIVGNVMVNVVKNVTMKTRIKHQTNKNYNLNKINKNYYRNKK